MLTQSRLKEVLDYAPDTGVFTWRSWRGGTAFAGSVAGRMSNGYIGISVDGQRYPAHRLAWLYMTGAWPADEVDHINGAKAHNAWANLRQADRAMNNQNRRRAYKGSASGVLGVSLGSAPGTFFARIRANGKAMHLGTFSSAELAHAAYVEAKRKLHQGCTL